MKPVDPGPIKTVFRKIFSAFPDYLPYEGQHGSDLEPHMTIAQFEDGVIPPGLRLPDYEPITFRAKRLHVWYGVRDQDLPWLTYEVLHLGR